MTQHGDAREPGGLRRQVIVTAIRMGFLVAFLTVALLFILRPSDAAAGANDPRFHWAVTLALAGIVAIAAIAADLLTPRKKIATLVSMFVGLVLATLATVILGAIIDVVVQAWDINRPEFAALAKVLLGISLAYLAIVTVLQTEDDFRLVIPYVEFSKQIRGPQPWLLDSSALVDGRVVPLAETGLFQARLIVSQFVIDELQRLSDSKDKLKRNRGRAGLDAVRRLQRSSAIEVVVETAGPHADEVDQALVELARRLPATIVTTDSGLERAASIHGVRVLNVHDLAQSMRPNVMPGEQVEVYLLRAGEQQGQAIGYLDDGTMVVAEDGGERIGERAMLTVRSTLQTSAGRLVFARSAGSDDAEEAAASLDATQPPPAAAATPGVEADEAAEPARVDARGPGRPARTPARPRSGRNPRR
ncbi:MAG: hypothetical protein AAFX79_04420 [Planctomycetota bacterium]